MSQDFELGKWIREKLKSQVAFAAKLGVNQSRVSKWLSLSEGISADYQEKIRKLGYKGPWPQEEAREVAAPAGGPYVTEKDFAEWRGYWRGGMEGVLERLKSLEDQVQKLRQQAESK